jgi:hypothetical protein
MEVTELEKGKIYFNTHNQLLYVCDEAFGENTISFYHDSEGWVESCFCIGDEMKGYFIELKFNRRCK